MAAIDEYRHLEEEGLVVARAVTCPRDAGQPCTSPRCQPLCQIARAASDAYADQINEVLAADQDAWTDSRFPALEDPTCYRCDRPLTSVYDIDKGLCTDCRFPQMPVWIRRTALPARQAPRLLRWLHLG